MAPDGDMVVTPPPFGSPEPDGRAWRVAGRIVAGLVGVLAGAVFAWCAVAVLRSRFSADLQVDPHGYVLIFGTILSIPAGLITAVALPWAFARRHRRLAYGITVPVVLVLCALLVAALLTA